MANNDTNNYKIDKDNFNNNNINNNINYNNILDILIDKIIEKKSPFCVGLDTNPEYIPDHIIEEAKSELILSKQNTIIPQNETEPSLINTFGFNNVLIGNAILKFNKIIIDKLKSFIPAVKIQLAFYEMIGPYGLYIFKKTLDYAKEKDLIVITDGKRNDIDSTAKAYSQGYLADKIKIKNYHIDNFNSDFLTVNPYLGKDGLIPFIENSYKYNKGIFVLAKTSNPSSGQLQDKILNGTEVYNLIISIVRDAEKEYLEKINKSNNLDENFKSQNNIILNSKYGFLRSGIVVGATYPEILYNIKNQFPDIFILIPGVGKQGGKISNIKKIFKDNFIGGIINVSRSVIFSYIDKKTNPEYFDEEALKEIKNLIDEFNS